MRLGAAERTLRDLPCDGHAARQLQALTLYEWFSVQATHHGRLLLSALFVAIVTTHAHADILPSTASTAATTDTLSQVPSPSTGLDDSGYDGAGQANAARALGRFPFKPTNRANSGATTSAPDLEDNHPTANQSEATGLRLAPPSTQQARGARSTKPPTPGRALSTVIGSLAVVLGLFFVVVWISRRTLPRASMPLPSEVVEVLGRAPLSQRQQMHLVRVGNKLILLSVTTGGAETLTEISDTDEVDRIAGICQQRQPGSISASFHQVLSNVGREPQPSGFVGHPPASDVDLANSGSPT